MRPGWKTLTGRPEVQRLLPVRLRFRTEPYPTASGQFAAAPTRRQSRWPEPPKNASASSQSPRTLPAEIICATHRSVITFAVRSAIMARIFVVARRGRSTSRSNPVAPRGCRRTTSSRCQTSPPLANAPTRAALLHGPEQIADLPVPVAESPGAVRIGHPERSHLVEYLAPNSVFNSLPRQRSSPHLRPDDRLVTIDRVLHHASLGVA